MVSRTIPGAFLFFLDRSVSRSAAIRVGEQAHAPVVHNTEYYSKSETTAVLSVVQPRKRTRNRSFACPPPPPTLTPTPAPKPLIHLYFTLTTSRLTRTVYTWDTRIKNRNPEPRKEQRKADHHHRGAPPPRSSKVLCPTVGVPRRSGLSRYVAGLSPPCPSSTRRLASSPSCRSTLKYPGAYERLLLFAFLQSVRETAASFDFSASSLFFSVHAPNTVGDQSLCFL